MPGEGNRPEPIEQEIDEEFSRIDRSEFLKQGKILKRSLSLSSVDNFHLMH